jgi:beta-glucanase (GH16 family)
VQRVSFAIEEEIMNLKSHVLGIVSATVGALCLGANVARANPPAGLGYRLVFSDEFTGTAVDTTQWTTDGYPWGALYHQDQAFKVASQLHVSNGVLTIKSEPGTVPGQPSTNYGTPFGDLPLNYLSGCITSKQRWHKGYFEARFKLPYQASSWPAFWMLQPGGSPPEIDIFEFHGGPFQDLYTFHYDNTYSAGHSWGGSYSGPNFSAAWHVFGMDWTDTHLDFYVDGAKIGHYTDQTKIAQLASMYFLIENQVGGWSPAPANGEAPAYMQLDYFRVWQVTGPAPGLYRLTPKIEATRALDTSDGTVPNSDQLVVAKATARADQQWYLDQQGDGSYLIRSSIDGTQVVTDAGPGATGESIQLTTADGSASQYWTIKFDTVGSWTISPKSDSTLVLSLGSGALSSNSPLDLATADGTTAHEWLLQAPAGPLKITDVAFSQVTTTTANITWKTNYNADSTVLYGTALNYGNVYTSPDNSTTHFATLTGLRPGTFYHFTARGTDMYGDVVTGRDGNFRTLPGTPSGLSISNLTYVADPVTGVVTATATVLNSGSAVRGLSINNALLAGGATTTAMPIVISSLPNGGTTVLTLSFPPIKPGVTVTLNLYGMIGTTPVTISLLHPVQ